MERLAAGSVVGILGGGQLGRMTAMALAELGYSAHIFCSDRHEPALEVAAFQTVASFKDEAALERFALSVDVVTLEWENVPLSALEVVARHVPVCPGADVLRIAQDRGLEKQFARDIGIGTADFWIVRSVEELDEVMGEISLPAILKSTRMGYDGKGQVLLTEKMSAAEAWHKMGAEEGIVEAFVDFACEISVIVARSEDGAMASYPPVRNVHKNHILATTTAPARIDPEIEKEAVMVAEKMADRLGVVGLLAVELFVLKTPDEEGRRVVMNEIAPRPHNSGHWTMDACACSQYEQLVRAVCGLPLGSAVPHSQAVMENLLGNDVDRVPEWLMEENACVHLYGKEEIREGRKMGHVTFLKGAWGS
jgi:5-(carboxyamino)imidazole ribonucleotide synthase